MINKRLSVTSRQIDENIAISPHEFLNCGQLIGIQRRNFELRAYGAQSLLKFCLRYDVFHYSLERRTKVKVNLPDFRRFDVIGLAEEGNVVVEQAFVGKRQYESPKNEGG